MASISRTETLVETFGIEMQTIWNAFKCDGVKGSSCITVLYLWDKKGFIMIKK